eukprot:s52_g44.t1
MKHAIRHVLQKFPEGFSRSPSVSQPLESESYPKMVVTEHDHSAIPSFSANVETPCAVSDTGCQRSAIGRSTLNRIAQHLPPGLSIRFQKKCFRFSGIGGETVTKELALIPVCFGSRPGVVHAAVLEDTADAPFLLSLPIMKELDTILHLNEHRMHFQALQESGKLFYNGRGQLCLRLFDFENLSPECHQPDRIWKPKKIVGDECQVFTLQCDGRVPSNHIYGENPVVNEKSNESIAGNNNFSYSNMDRQSNEMSRDSQSCPIECKMQLKEHSQVQISSQSGAQFVSNLSAPDHVSSPQVSSTAETPDRPADLSRVLSDHVGTHGASQQQASMHRDSAGAQSVCAPEVGSHVFTHQVPDALGTDRQSVDQLGHPVDVHAQAGTGSDDPSGRSRGNGCCPGPREQHDSGEEGHGKGKVSQVISDCSKISEVESFDQCGQLRDGLRDQQIQPQVQGGKFFPESGAGDSTSGVLLRPDSKSSGLSQRGTELSEEVLPVPQAVPAECSMRILRMGREHQSGGVRASVSSPECYFGNAATAQAHQEEIKACLRSRIRNLRRRRLGLGSEPSDIFAQNTSTTSSMPTRVESEGNQCLHQDENLSPLRSSGNDQVQGWGEDDDLCRRHHAQEVGQNSSCEPVNLKSGEPLNLKSGERKRILGEINKQIQWLENQPPVEDECHYDKKMIEQIMHVRLLGEVFSPERFLSKASQHGLEPGRAYDLVLGQQLLDPENRRKCLNHFKRNHYGLVVVTPPCTMFSLLQFLGIGKSMETCQQDPEYQRRYQEAMVLLNFACIICELQLRRGGSFLFEQPWNALSWKEGCLQKLLHDPRCMLVRTDQCMFQQRDANGSFLRKRTGFLTNNKMIARCLQKSCHGRHTHGQCVGSIHGKSVAAGAARYTNSLVHAVLKAYSKSCSNQDCQQELYLSSVEWQHVCPDGTNQPLQHTIRLHRASVPQDLHESASDDWCFVSNPTEVTYQFEHASSVAQFAVNVLRDEMPLQPVPAPNELEEQELQQLSPQQRRALNQEIDKAHKGMGHPNHDRFLRILKLGGASNATLALAKMYKRSQCKENTRPKPWRRSAPPRELQFNEVVGVDTFTVKHFDHSIKCLNIICWGTRYQMVVPLQGESAAHARAAYRQWVKLFGPPKVLKPDLGTEFLRDFLYRCSTDGTEVDPSSLESPTQNSITEREGGSFKTMFNKASLDYGRTDDVGEIQELLETVVMYKNRLTHRGGYSAIHRVFGYTPSMPGDVLMSREQEDNLQHHDMISLGDVTLQRQQRMRECAGKAFFSAECAAAIRRVVASGPRTTEPFEVGQLVYFWSRGQFNKVGVHHSATRRPNHAFWNGPCRVIATQYPTSIYIALQGRLIKAAPEQCRRVSEDEDASCSDVLKRLCTVRDSIRDTKISGVSDIRGEPFPDFDHPTGRKRTYGKQAPVVRSKVPRLEQPPEPAALDDMSEGYPSPSLAEDSDAETMAMESDQELLLEIETEDHPLDVWYQSVPENAQEINKKASKEIKLKDLNQHDASLFKAAIEKEWNTNIANGAIKVLDPVESQRIRQQMPNRVMQSRLLHVAKPLDDPNQIEANQVLQCSPQGIPCKAKSRWIARGDKDPDIFSVCASSPVIHRDTFMLGLQVLASKRWRMHFADFSQAFMQGDGLQREQPLFCEPPVKDLPGVQPGSLIQICKTVYGLVDAPYRWNQHLDKLFKSMGYQPSLLDACCYMLHSPETQELEGIIMVATDDLISGGNSRHQALMDAMKQKYKFGKWEHDVGRFCGKDLRQNKDYSISVSQQYYADTKCQGRIHIPKGLSNETPCTPEQVKSLREKVGALSWLCKETRIDLCGSVSLLMQAFPNPTIGDLKTCNRILKEAILYKDLEVCIRPIQPEDLCIVVSSDAAWANAKDEEGEHKSQAGYVVLAAHRDMLRGEEAKFSMIGWKSHTLKRRTVSTLSAETQGIVESAAVACWYRYLLAEPFYRPLVRQNEIDWETMIEPLEFGLVTDAKSVYDALTCPPGSGSTDKRTTIDLAIIREYLRRHNGCIRWIDGRLQLADSLTKFMTADFLRSVMQRGSYQLRAEYETLELKQQAKMEKNQRKKEKPVKSVEVKPTESVGDVKGVLDQKIQSAAIAMQVLLPDLSEEKITTCLRENHGDADRAWHQLQDINDVDLIEATSDPPGREPPSVAPRSVSSDSLGDILAAIEVAEMADVANEAPSEAPSAELAPSTAPAEAELPAEMPVPAPVEVKVEEKTTPDWLPMLKSQPSTKRGLYEKQTDRLKAALGPAPKTPAVQSAHDLDVRGTCNANLKYHPNSNAKCDKGAADPQGSLRAADASWSRHIGVAALLLNERSRDPEN